jgi:hypothetical protein
MGVGFDVQRKTSSGCSFPGTMIRVDHPHHHAARGFEEFMRIDFHGLVFETPRLTFHLWTPWRACSLEHRLFDAVRQALQLQPEEHPDELRLVTTETKTWRSAQQAMVRVLKGWQEEADAGREKRAFRWLLEGDSDTHGYDSFGEPLSLWMFLRVSLDRGGPGEPDKGEDVDLEGFTVRIWGSEGR